MMIVKQCTSKNAQGVPYKNNAYIIYDITCHLEKQLNSTKSDKITLF